MFDFDLSFSNFSHEVTLRKILDLQRDNILAGLVAKDFMRAQTILGIKTARH